jgi:hypothetical protein
VVSDDASLLVKVGDETLDVVGEIRHGRAAGDANAKCDGALADAVGKVADTVAAVTDAGDRSQTDATLEKIAETMAEVAKQLAATNELLNSSSSTAAGSSSAFAGVVAMEVECNVSPGADPATCNPFNAYDVHAHFSTNVPLPFDRGFLFLCEMYGTDGALWGAVPAASNAPRSDLKCPFDALDADSMDAADIGACTLAGGYQLKLELDVANLVSCFALFKH